MKDNPAAQLCLGLIIGAVTAFACVGLYIGGEIRSCEFQNAPYQCEMTIRAKSN